VDKHHEVASSPFGRIAVSTAAIAQIVGHAAAESYGVVALAGPSRLTRLLPWGDKQGIDVERRENGLAIELRVVVEHGLKLAEVATAVRSRVLYEIDRMIGLPVVELQVHIEGVREG
jgi:uncharacterized alkaline shock family protein YloU